MKQSAALALMKLGKNIFLTGSPGSGKTYLLNQYIRYLKDHNVSVAVTASTGIAATHVQGITIHAWSGIGIKESLNESDLVHLLKKKVIRQHYQKTKTLIIDEISMLHSYQLDMIDTIARRLLKAHKPFGGLQVIVCGDFFQLPPVSSSALSSQKRFAFEAEAWTRGHFYVCYLEEQHRQGDDPLRTILEAIRSGTAGEQTKIPLRTRYKKEPEGPTKATRLYARNVNVDEINACELAKIDEKEKIFHMTSHSFVLVKSLQKSCLAPEVLRLKIGAEVMFIKNDAGGRYVNGTRGVVTGFDKEEGWPRVRTYDRQSILGVTEAWNHEDMGMFQASVSQVPLRLAWSMTIHKSQGMTLDAAEMDLGDVFELGMGYVALSRVRCLSGLKLMNLNELALKVDPKILAYDHLFKQDAEVAVNYLQAFSETALEQGQRKTLLERFEGTAQKIDNIHKQAKNKKKSRKSNDFTPTHLITLDLLKQKLSIPSIAEKRASSVDTIVSHLEKLQHLKQLDLASVDCLKDMMSPSDFDRIIAELRHAEDGRLTPIYEEFEGRYSYPTLKVVRLFLNR